MRNRNSFILMAGVASLCLTLSACGNGGSSGPERAPVTAPPPTFSVSLSSMEMTRTATAEPVEVDTSGVESGTLTLNGE